LTKPGIIYGNLISALGGFLFAAQGNINWLLGLAALSGTAFVIASGCTLNNYIDREIDAKMARTKQRALVQGTIPDNHALLYAASLSLAGFAILAFFTNILTLYVGLAGIYCYVVAYGITKRKGPIGTIIGSFAGSTPILAGYTAVTGRLDGAAILLFLAMALWQMPHFYAIAMFRLKDYQNAGIPVLPAVKGTVYAKYSIMGYVAAYGVTVSLLTILGYASYMFLVAMLGLSLLWLWKGTRGFNQKSNADNITWARGMFGYSLIVMLSFSILLGIESFL
jgi:protoheme IX farnesyltransferase